MSYLTEVEIFDRMKASLRTAIEACEQLAIEPYKGPMYLHFREHMKLVDGCCRQASAWREDTRWLNIANLIFKSRTMAGNWLRGEEVVRKPDGVSAVMFARLNAPHAYKCFTTLAQNLKQIELALFNYESTYHALPPAYTVDAEGNALHSWRTLILPYLDQTQLYEKIDLSKPWNDPVNAEAFNTRVPVFQCPSTAHKDNNTLLSFRRLQEEYACEIIRRVGGFGGLGGIFWCRRQIQQMYRVHYKKTYRDNCSMQPQVNDLPAALIIPYTPTVI